MSGEQVVTARQRLVIELNSRTISDLDWITQTEGVNKTTAVNRALQVYRLAREAQERGDDVVIGGRAVRFL